MPRYSSGNSSPTSSDDIGEIPNKMENEKEITMQLILSLLSFVPSSKFHFAHCAQCSEKRTQLLWVSLKWEMS